MKLNRKPLAVALGLACLVSANFIVGCEVHARGGFDQVDIVDDHGWHHRGYYDDHHDWHGGYTDDHNVYHDDDRGWHQ